MRLDAFLAQRGMTPSRAKAKEMILSGCVWVDGREIRKPAWEVEGNNEVVLRQNPLQRYVSRGGLKLEVALQAFALEVRGKVAVDIGSSSGGFTDCLLQHGAARVYAVDCGTAQLHPSLREDARVCVMEQTNARMLNATSFPEPVDLAVMDVSFISQTLLYPAICTFLVPGGHLVSLIKPQFEAGRGALNKSGVLQDAQLRAATLDHVLRTAQTYGLACLGHILSPITGGDGNVEYMALFRWSGVSSDISVKEESAHIKEGGV